MRRISFILIGVITYILQAQIFPELFHSGWLPDLFLVWVILVSFIKGRRKGLLIALIAGFMQDVMIGSFFGIHLIPYIVIALIVSYIGRNYHEEQWYQSVFIVLIGTILNSILQMGMLYVAFPYMSFIAYIRNFIVLSVFANAFLAIFVHKLIWHLTEPEEYFW